MLVINALWLLLPAAFANMAPVLAKPLFPRWDTPVDFGHVWKEKEIFGSHKTYRGFASGIFLGFIVFYFQQLLYQSFPAIRNISLFNYVDVHSVLGAWMGFSALLGDLIKSFFKRRFSIRPGRPWIPFDQIDWIIGALLGICVVYVPTLTLVLVSLAIGVAFHFLIKYIGFLWKLNPTPL